MGPADHAAGDRKRLQHPLRLVHRPAVVQDLVDVLPALRRLGVDPGLELENLGHRGLRSLYARRENGLLGGQRRQQDAGVGHGLENAVVAGHGRCGGSDMGQEDLPVEAVRDRRKRTRVVVDRAPFWALPVAHEQQYSLSITLGAIVEDKSGIGRSSPAGCWTGSCRTGRAERAAGGADGVSDDAARALICWPAAAGVTLE